jgi:deazaflavin-dependent oxidoreductase (nitroreductase family)
MSDWNDKIIEEFRSNNGVVGGPFKGSPLLLLHTKGRKSGRDYVHPVMYLDHDGRRFVFASKAGAPENPQWYLNLVADPEVTVEVGTDKYEAAAAALPTEERDRIYAVQAGLYPGFAEYQEKTSRKIPVVEITARS